MKKKAVAILMIFILSAGLWACEKAESEKTKSDTSASTTSQETVNVKTKTEEIAGYNFEIPESWEPGNNTSDTKYYYPENAMLMASFTKLDQSITDENFRNTFISSFVSTLENSSIKSDEQIEIADSEGYTYDIDFTVDSAEWSSSFVIFDGNGGAVSFFMASQKESDTDYTEQFQSVLESITAVNQQANDSSDTTSASSAENIEASNAIPGSQVYDIINSLAETGIPTAEAAENSDGFQYDSTTDKYAYSISTNTNHEVMCAQFFVFSQTDTEGYLGYCASMPYDTADPSAQQWVNSNAGSEAEATFGDAIYTLSVGTQGPILTIKALGYDDYIINQLSE